MPDGRRIHPETRDVDGRAILLFGGGLAGFILIVLLALRLLFADTPPPLAFGEGTGLAGSGNPVLQTDPAAERIAYDAEKRKQLESIGWVDRGAGLAHIPIEDAMRMIAAHGVPDWGQHAAASAGDCGAESDAVPRAPRAPGCPARTVPP